MMPGATLLWAGLAVVAGAGVLFMKYEVQTEERHLRHVQKEIFGTEQSIHVLKAEWSYLNDPLHLREQAEHHLGLHPMRANQIVTIPSIPKIGDKPAEASAAVPSAPVPPPVKAVPSIKMPASPPVHPLVPQHRPTTPGHSMTAMKAKPHPHAMTHAVAHHIAPGKVPTKAVAKLQHPASHKVMDPEVASTRMRP